MTPESVRYELLKMPGITGAEYFMVQEKTMFLFILRTEDKRFGKFLNVVVRNKYACIMKKEVQATKKEIKNMLNGQKRRTKA